MAGYRLFRAKNGNFVQFPLGEDDGFIQAAGVLEQRDFFFARASLQPIEMVPFARGSNLPLHMLCLYQMCHAYEQSGMRLSISAYVDILQKARTAVLSQEEKNKDKHLQSSRRLLEEEIAWSQLTRFSRGEVLVPLSAVGRLYEQIDSSAYYRLCKRLMRIH